MSTLATKHTSATLLEASGLDVALDPAITPVWHGSRVAGPAFPVQGLGGDNLALHNAVRDCPAGHVLVVDVGGRPFGHWGEVLAVAAIAAGIAGLVIDGGVRDSVEQEEQDMILRFVVDLAVPFTNNQAEKTYARSKSSNAPPAAPGAPGRPGRLRRRPVLPVHRPQMGYRQLRRPHPTVHHRRLATTRSRSLLNSYD